MIKIYLSLMIFLLVLSLKDSYSQTNVVTNGSFTGNLSGWTNSGGWTLSSGRAVDYTDGNVTQTLSQSLANIKVNAGSIDISFDYQSGNCTCSAGVSYTNFDVSFAGTNYLSIAVPVGTSNNTATVNNGASVNISSFAQVTTVSIVLTIPWAGATPASGVLAFTHRPAGGWDDSFIDNVFVAQNVLMPVKLSNFSGDFNNGYTHLFWQTTEEFNTSVFVIENSQDGIAFEKAGTVACTNSPLGAKYDFSTRQSGYFRLKMVDVDGHTEYSKSIRVINNSDGHIEASVVFPNPVVGNNFTLSIGDTKLKNTTAALYTIAGKRVNKYNVSSDSQVFAITNIPSGIYILKLANGENIKIFKK